MPVAENDGHNFENHQHESDDGQHIIFGNLVAVKSWELARMVEGLLTENFRLKQQNLRLLKYLLHGQTEGQQRAA